MTNRAQLGLGLLIPAITVAISGCGADNNPFVIPPVSDGLVFTFPVDGMVDVPTPSKAMLVFSSQVNKTAVMANCSGTAEAPVGAFCVTGPDGPVETSSHTAIVNNGRTIEFSMDGLTPGVTYQVWLNREASPKAANLPSEGPLFSFTTRQEDPIKGQIPAVLAFNQENPLAFVEGSEVEPEFPIVDISPIRLTFNEPLFDDSVVLGNTVQFVKVNEDSSEEAVDVDMLAERHYITLQPNQDMQPNVRYEVRLGLGDGIVDLNGEALEPVTYSFVPRSTKASPGAANPPIYQTLQTFPDMNTPGYPGKSKITGGPTNQFTLENTALGVNVANSLPNGLEAYLANPQAFGGTKTPVLARKGQQLQLTGINPAKLGGEVHTDLETGLITGTFLSNVTGYLMPNIYRPNGHKMDDDKSPLYVYMDFDLSLQTENLQGNATLNQNLMHVRAIGLATIENHVLTLEVFRTLQLDVLGGATKVAADFSLQAKADPAVVVDYTNYDAPFVSGAYPSDGKVGVETSDNILLAFNEPLSPAGLDEIQLLDMGNGGTPVELMVKRSGTSLTISPQARLNPATEYQLILSSNITDIHGTNPLPLASSAEDALGGDNTLTFTTADYTRTANAAEDAPPIILGLHPGIGCALVETGVPGYAGRCKGGLDDDELYLDFQYEIGRVIEASFSQPMDTDSMVLGTIAADGNSCVDGPICLGQDTGASWESIDAALVPSNLKFQIFPAEGTFVAGEEYRLVVNGDSSPKFYSHDNLGHLPLNTTPLEGIGDTPKSGNPNGGDNIVINFTAVAPFDTVYATVYTRPYADFNGSGGWDDGEPQPCTTFENGQPVDESCSNFATAEVLGTSGLIVDASLEPGRDKIFASGALPMAFKPKQPLDLSVPDLGMIDQGDGSWCLSELDDLGLEHCLNVEGTHMIPVEVNHQVILGTGLTINADAGIELAGLPIALPLKLNTRSVLLRTRPERPDPQSEVLPLNGYIVNLEGEEQPYFIVRLPAWLDVPDLDLVTAVQEALTQMLLGEDTTFLGFLGFLNLEDFVDNVLATHTAKSLAITAYLYGPISFQDDGRITLKVTNLNNVKATLGLELLPDLLDASLGEADLLLPAEEVSLQVMNLPSRARKLPENAQ